MQQQGSGAPSPAGERVRLEEQYKAIGIAALAAAVGAARGAGQGSAQMSATNHAAGTQMTAQPPVATD